MRCKFLMTDKACPSPEPFGERLGAIVILAVDLIALLGFASLAVDVSFAFYRRKDNVILSGIKVESAW